MTGKPNPSPMTASTFSQTTSPPAGLSPRRLSRNAMIALAVVALHTGFIWALQSGLLMRATEMVVSADILSQFVAPPAPESEAVPSVPTTPAAGKNTAAKAHAVPVPPSQPSQSVPTLQPQAQPLAMIGPTPSLDAVPGAVLPPLPAAAPAPGAAASAAALAPAAQAVVQLPSSNADYLRNPKPLYPPLSARLGETGKVVYKVWIGTDGKAQRAELVTSSGFSRLDNAAYETVMHWRYVPGKHNGVAQTMPVNVPIVWELQN